MSETNISAAGSLLDAPVPPTDVPTDTPPTDVPPTDTPPIEPEAPTALTLPPKDATPEQMADFYKALGRPETPDAYELPVPEGDDGAFAKTVAPILHKHGLTAEQAKGLAADWNAMQETSMQAAQAAETAHNQAMEVKNQAEAAALKNEWGASFEANSHFAKQAVSQFVDKEHANDVIAAIESKIGYAATIKFFHGIGKGLAEHDAAGLGSSSQGSATARPIGDRLYGNK